MPRPYAYIAYLIMATGRKRYPFMLLSVAGILAYFVTREDAEHFIQAENA